MPWKACCLGRCTAEHCATARRRPRLGLRTYSTEFAGGVGVGVGQENLGLYTAEHCAPTGGGGVVQLRTLSHPTLGTHCESAVGVLGKAG